MLNTYPCNPFPISSEQLHKGDNEDLQAQINAITDGSVIDSFGDVETALDTKADNDIIAPEFDAEAGTYEIGDLVMYQGKLYEFITAHETAGDWDPTEVTEKTVADEIDTVKSGLNSKLVVNIESASDTTYAYLERVPGRSYIICVNTKGSNGINGYDPLVGVLRMGYQGQNFSYTPILTSDTYNIDITHEKLKRIKELNVEYIINKEIIIEK